MVLVGNQSQVSAEVLACLNFNYVIYFYCIFRCATKITGWSSPKVCLFLSTKLHLGAGNPNLPTGPSRTHHTSLPFAKPRIVL